MNKLHTPHLSLLLLWIIFTTAPTYAQVTLKGSIVDVETGETIIGARISLKDRVLGTISDIDGRFVLSTNMEPPILLEINSVGYEVADFTSDGSESEMIIMLIPETGLSKREFVVSASRVEERILEAPVSIHKSDLVDFRYTTAPDYYNSLANLKEVFVHNSSLTFPVINTRGFSDAQNWRFVQLRDGIDLNLPGLGFSVGSIASSSDLDVERVEITPGPGSALYGPNALNGLMNTYTKNPFEYQGVSFLAKSGATNDVNDISHPFGEIALRVAKVWKDKWAFKLNANYYTATDYEVNDLSYHVTPEKAALQESLLQLDPSSPNFDAISRFGDESFVGVDLVGDGTLTNINRSGIRERDILDYDIESVKLNAALHFRPTERLEISYDATYNQGDLVLRHTTVYPFTNASTFSHKLEIKSRYFNTKIYQVSEESRDSYLTLATGNFIQQGLKDNGSWAADYGRAYRGEIQGVDAGNHQAARLFADRDLPGPESNEFKQLLSATLANPDIRTGGSKFIDESSLIHGEFNSDLSDLLGGWNLQLGGSVRRYLLDSDGELFNDGPNGFGNPIDILETGAYLQTSTAPNDDEVPLRLRASLRFDKNSNYKARITPRIAGVLSLGENRQHNFRLSYQTGFRNPASQESYIALDLGEAIILGGTEDNLENYTYQNADGVILDGIVIRESLVTIPSYQAFVAGGGMDPSVLVPASIETLRQEQISTIELGYKGLLEDQFYLDLNVYFSTYEDLVTRRNALSPVAGRVFSLYANVPERISSTGAGVAIEWSAPLGYRLKASYMYAEYNAEEAIRQNPEFLPS
ncbi:MAG: carboxypeptidase-like regulatory domain-containing protein, partial [Bacteroidota bacterium]